jgi:hypothetical protein
MGNFLVAKSPHFYWVFHSPRLLLNSFPQPRRLLIHSPPVNFEKLPVQLDRTGNTNGKPSQSRWFAFQRRSVLFFESCVMSSGALRGSASFFWVD